MRRQFVSLAAIATLAGAGAAYAQQPMSHGAMSNGSMSSGGMSSGTITANGTAANRMSPSAMADMARSPTGYITAAGESDKFEITEGKLASTMGATPQVRAFGQKMIHDHTQSTMMVLKAAKMSGMPKMQPPVLRPAQQDMVAKLKATSGPAFDQMYIQQQMQSHQQALMVQQNYAQHGTNKDLKMAATKIVPVVEQHISMLQGLSSGM